MRATAWRMRIGRHDRDRHARAAPAAARARPRRPGFDGLAGDDEVAYRDALEWRWIDGQLRRARPGDACGRGSRCPLVAGEETSPLERLLVMADAASGVSADARLAASGCSSTSTWASTCERPPRGEWMAMDARTRIGDAGAGLCTSVLSDGLGRVGVSTQTLLVEPRA